MNGIVNKPVYGDNVITFNVTYSYKGSSLDRTSVRRFFSGMDTYVKIIDLRGNVNIIESQTLRTTAYFALQNASLNFSPSFSVEPEEGGVTCSFNQINLSQFISSIEFGYLS